MEFKVMARNLAVGNKVIWSDKEGYKHRDIHNIDLANTSEFNDCPIGRVEEVANIEGTWFKVAFEDGTDKVLTFEELVKVIEEDN